MAELSDEDKLHTALVKGSRARAIMEDPLVVETLEALEQESIASWKRARDVDSRETAYSDVMALQRFRDRMARFMSDGVFAQREINARN